MTATKGSEPSPTAARVPVIGWWVYTPTERLPVGQPHGVPHPHRLAWGDDKLSFIVCVRCGTGFARNVRVLDTLTPCSGVGDRSVREWTKGGGGGP